MPREIVGSHISNTRNSLSRIRRLIILMRKMPISRRDLGFLKRSVNSTPERLNNKSTLAIAEPIVTVCSERSQGTLGSGTSLTIVSNIMHLTPKIPRRTYMDVRPSNMLLLRSSTRPRKICKCIWRPSRNRTRCYSNWPRKPAPNVSWKISRVSIKKVTTTQEATAIASLAINIQNLLYLSIYISLSQTGLRYPK